MNKFYFLLLALLIAGCIAPPIKENIAEIELPEALPSKQLNVPLIYSGLDGNPGLCYLGSFAMTQAYYKPELTFSDIIAYSGIGSNALYLNPPMMSAILMNGYGEASIIQAAKNLGVKYYLGLLKGGTHSDMGNPSRLFFNAEAEEVTYFDNETQALDYLKRVISSGNPAIVHLDMYYVNDELGEQSRFWNTVPKLHMSHYVTITGYDEEYIYFNDPIDEEQGKNLRAGISNFIEAWGNTNQLRPPIGPNWIVYSSNESKPKTTQEIIAWNKELGSTAVSNIRNYAGNYASNEMSEMLFIEFSRARQAYGVFLINNNHEEAGSLYIDSGELMTEDLTTDLINEIADKEETAINKIP